MMIWTKIGLLLMCTWALPFCLGMLPVRLMREEHRSFGMIWISGWMLMFGIFQILVAPFIVAGASFSAAANWYTVVIFTAALFCLFLGRKALTDCVGKLRSIQPEKGWLLFMLLFLALLLLQLAAAFFMQYLDGDDSFFVASSLTSQHTDAMYLYNPYYGADGELDLRHALSPVPVFMAWLSRISGIHVTIICHSYICMLFLILMYAVYAQVGICLFPRQKRRQWLFLLFLSLWYLWGNVSIYAAESFAYTRTWQGKAMFPNLIVPALFLWLFFLAGDAAGPGEWGMLLVLVLCACFTTSIGIFTVPVLLGAAAVILALQKKRPVILLQMAGCLLPGVFYGLLYLLLK